MCQFLCQFDSDFDGRWRTFSEKRDSVNIVRHQRRRSNSRVSRRAITDLGVRCSGRLSYEPSAHSIVQDKAE